MIDGDLKRGDVFYHPNYYETEGEKVEFIEWEVEFPIPEHTTRVPCLTCDNEGVLRRETFERFELYRTRNMALKAYHDQREKS